MTGDLRARPPAPLEWHPAYRDMPGLLDWLNNPTSTTWHLPITPPLRLRFLPQEQPAPDALCADLLRRHVLTKRKARGLAPYVGRPFVYEWPVATDELGRSIAGEAHIVYDMGYLG